MRRSFFIKIHEEIVTTLTILRFSHYFFDPYPAEICMRLPLRGNTTYTVTSSGRCCTDKGTIILNFECVSRP